MRVNCNISAIIANSKLVQSQSGLDKAIARLSSGLKINSAEDDAAGLAIANRLHTQIKGLGQSSKNVADGISVVSTAESALSETHNILQRIRELCIQGANDTNCVEDRAAIQQEIEALLEEVDRISKDTEFNTMPLLQGALNRRCYSDTDGISVLNLTDVVKPGEYKFNVISDAQQASASVEINQAAFTPDGAPDSGNVVINGAAVSINKGDSYDTVVSNLMTACDSANLTYAAGTPPTITTYEYGISQKITYDIPDSLAGFFNITNVTNGLDAQVEFAADSGFSETATIIANGKQITVSDVGGFDLTVEFEPGVAAATQGNSVTVEVTDIGSLTVQMGTMEGQVLEINIPVVNTHTLGIEYINVCTSEGGMDAVAKIDAAVNAISSVRSKLGAYQNRMEDSVTHLDTYEYNITAAVSRIEDADMAEEMTNYTQENVITQAATSMLAQANERPQSVLQLLSR